MKLKRMNRQCFRLLCCPFVAMCPYAMLFLQELQHPTQARQLCWALPFRAMLLHLLVISLLIHRSLAGED